MSTPYYTDEAVTLYHGDALDVLRELADSSVDAVVCDPPYGLANTTPAQVADTLLRWVNGERDYLPSARGFMGKEWDGFVPPVAVWDECMRVLKPGGHMLVFAGSRTQDLMGLAIRLAGFDIRDSIAWLYGSGFPKSLDVSKAIDKARDEDAEPRRDVCRLLRAALVNSGRTRREIDEHFGTANVSQYWFSPDRNSQVPPVEKWPWVRDFLGIGPELDAEVWRLNGRKGKPGENWDKREVTGKHFASVATGDAGMTVRGEGKDRRDTPATPDAERWQGFGTSLKPGHEPIILARKPFPTTVAANVLEHGTGALNIDACRVEGEPWTFAHGPTTGRGGGIMGEPMAREGVAQSHPAGRWPANVVLDDSQAAELDEQSGESAPKPARTGRKGGCNDNGTMTGYGTGDDVGTWPADAGGGASRFFPTFRYEAKAPTSERPRVDGVTHPTVKPLNLMRWLVRLVTPPGGTVLEPFAGSGTTGEACLLEGFQSILIEREADYLPLIRHRITRRRDPIANLRDAGEDLGLFEEPA